MNITKYLRNWNFSKLGSNSRGLKAIFVLILLISVVTFARLNHHNIFKKPSKVVAPTPVSQSLSIEGIKSIVTSEYYDYDLSDYGRFKSGVEQRNGKQIFFIADESLTKQSYKEVSSLPESYENSYIGVINLRLGYVAALIGSPTAIKDMSIADGRGRLITGSIWDTNLAYKKVEGGAEWIIKSWSEPGHQPKHLALELTSTHQDGYIEIDLSTGRVIEGTYMQYPRGTNPHPIKFYPEQIGKIYTWQGYEYAPVLIQSMNVIVVKYTDYAGIVRRRVGEKEWHEYIKLENKNAHNNVYNIWFTNGMYVLIVDTYGAGSGEGWGKLLKINGRHANLVKCFDYPISGVSEYGLQDILDAQNKDGEYCHNFEIVFI